MHNGDMGKKSTTSVAFFNKVVVHPMFRKTIEDMKHLDIKIPPNASDGGMEYSAFPFPPGGEKVEAIGPIKKVMLKPKEGEHMLSGYRPIVAYDESIGKYSALEGEAFFTSHSLVLLGKEYVPLNEITLYFYTRSGELASKSKYIKKVDDPQLESKRDYLFDKIRFLEAYVPENALLLIDGPLIGGDLYTIVLNSLKKLISREIFPIFFVKNSSSNLVTDHLSELKGKYNSDMHWAHNFLGEGYRTNFFRYEDVNNPKNAKIFCYIKPLSKNIQRIEFDTETFEKYGEEIEHVINLIYYFVLAQGNAKNPQVRPIAVAEMYARETLKIMELNKIMKNIGITPTMNQERFGW